MKSKKIIIYGIFLVLIVNLVNAIGISQPSPSEIEIKPGESERFFYQIQPATNPLECKTEIKDAAGLEITFDEATSKLEAKKSENKFGAVTAPQGLPNGEYNAQLCVTCSVITDDLAQGSALKYKNCNLPLRVIVVGERTRENNPPLSKPEKPFEFPEIPFYYYAIIILVLIALIFWYLKDKKH